MSRIDLARALPDRVPDVGELVHVRSRQWLVKAVVPPETEGQTSRVRLACAEDDAEGQQLEVFWDQARRRESPALAGWARGGRTQVVGA